jgi:antitoxin component YwqK of YwqJK toxin-antitoxin module
MRDIFKKDNLYHRESGPAYILYHRDGLTLSERYFVNGKYHRVGGPAHIEYHRDGTIIYKAYYKDGKRVNDD